MGGPDRAGGAKGELRAASSAELAAADLADLRGLFATAWPDGDFTEDDLRHAMGGRHWLLRLDGRLVSHAVVVERELLVGGWPLRTGYLEAVATAPGFERRGFGTRVVLAATEHIRERYELGALSTGSPPATSPRTRATCRRPSTAAS
jgi:aminoglycoside 2'-N-acetyltransferase I